MNLYNIRIINKLVHDLYFPITLNILFKYFNNILDIGLNIFYKISLVNHVKHFHKFHILFISQILLYFYHGYDIIIY
jgi:hypothetical protein